MDSKIKEIRETIKAYERKTKAFGTDGTIDDYYMGLLVALDQIQRKTKRDLGILKTRYNLLKNEKNLKPEEETEKDQIIKKKEELIRRLNEENVQLHREIIELKYNQDQ